MDINDCEAMLNRCVANCFEHLAHAGITDVISVHIEQTDSSIKSTRIALLIDNRDIGLLGKLPDEKHTATYDGSGTVEHQSWFGDGYRIHACVPVKS